MARSLKRKVTSFLKSGILTGFMKERKKRRTHAITGGFNSDGTVNPVSNIRRCQN